MNDSIPPWMRPLAWEAETFLEVLLRVMIVYAAGFTIAGLFVLATLVW